MIEKEIDINFFKSPGQALVWASDKYSALKKEMPCLTPEQFSANLFDKMRASTGSHATIKEFLIYLKRMHIVPPVNVSGSRDRAARCLEEFIKGEMTHVINNR